jgi:hypothetical protein
MKSKTKTQCFQLILMFLKACNHDLKRITDFLNISKQTVSNTISFHELKSEVSCIGMQEFHFGSFEPKKVSN